MQRVIQHVYLIPLFISMLLSLKSFRLRWHPIYQRFSILLICVFIVEIFALLWKYVLHDIGSTHFSNSNLWLYNCFLIPQYLLYMSVFYGAIQSRSIKKIIITLGIAYTLFGVANLVFVQSIHEINSFTMILASAIIVFLSIAYFEEIRKKAEIIHLNSHPMVWISFGALLFHLGNLPYMISLEYLIKHNVNLAVTLFYMYLTLSCITYIIYSIAFLCPKPLQK